MQRRLCGVCEGVYEREPSVQGRVLLVTEFMAGGNLYDAIASGASDLGWYQRGRRIALDVVKGLVHLHSRSIIHLVQPGAAFSGAGRSPQGMCTCICQRGAAKISPQCIRPCAAVLWGSWQAEACTAEALSY